METARFGEASLDEKEEAGSRRAKSCQEVLGRWKGAEKEVLKRIRNDCQKEAVWDCGSD
jgi:hypothetical protein